MSHSNGRRGPRNPLRSALALVAVLVSGCGSGDPPTNASTNLSGTWELSFATSGSSCPFPPGLLPGCGGGGRLTLVHDIDTVSGTIPLVLFCQSCGSVADAFGRVEQPVSGRVRDRRLELRLSAGCQLVANLGPGDVREVSGEATCVYDDAQTTGTWRMSRAE